MNKCVYLQIHLADSQPKTKTTKHNLRRACNPPRTPIPFVSDTTAKTKPTVGLRSRLQGYVPLTMPSNLVYVPGCWLTMPSKTPSLLGYQQNVSPQTIPRVRAGRTRR